MKPNDSLDALFNAARTDTGDTSRLEFGFETRLMARLRSEKSSSWLGWAWKLCPYFAVLAIGAGTWAVVQHEEVPAGESLFTAVRLAGTPVLNYCLGQDE